VHPGQALIELGAEKRLPWCRTRRELLQEGVDCSLDSSEIIAGHGARAYFGTAPARSCGRPQESCQLHSSST
jgi:hypothetical protein